jgi:hypothetical protein
LAYGDGVTVGTVDFEFVCIFGQLKETIIISAGTAEPLETSLLHRPPQILRLTASYDALYKEALDKAMAQWRRLTEPTR